MEARAPGSATSPAQVSSGAAVGSGSTWSRDAGLWLTAAFVAWALVAGFFGLGLLRSWLRLRRLLAVRRPIEAGPASTMLARLSAGASFRRRVRLSSSSQVDVPIAVGVLRPEIVVPDRALVELQPAELESLLAHELAHLKRRDPAWRLVTGCIQRVLFVQPLNRVAAANLENASEMLCDDWAVERTERPLALARCLTEVAAWVATPLGASVPAMARHGSGLGRRVRRLIASGEGTLRQRRERWPIPVAGGALALVVFAAPGASEMASPRLSTPLPYAPTRLVSTEAQIETPAEETAGETAHPERAGDARRLLEELRAGKLGNHDLADWVALAQLLGSSSRDDLDQTLHSGSDVDAAAAVGGIPFDPEGIRELIEGALKHALSQNGIDIDVDFDFDFDAHGGIDIHINGLDILNRHAHDGHDDAVHFDLDFDLELPDLEFDLDVDIPDPPEVPDPPEAPEPPEPPEASDLPEPPDPPDGFASPDSDCDGHDHASATSRAREIGRQAREAGRVARAQARQALEQARQAMAHAHRQVHAQVRRDARLAREQARRIREQFAEQLQMAERVRKEAKRERERVHHDLMRQLKEQQRERQRYLEEQERERERQLEEQERARRRYLKEQERERERQLEEQERERERQLEIERERQRHLEQDAT